MSLEMSDEVHCLACHQDIHRDRFRVHRNNECTNTSKELVKCDVLKGRKCDMPYRTLLAAAPAHDTDEFLQYLRDNNKVVMENEAWLVIENFKYHTPEKPWYTAFAKTDDWQTFLVTLIGSKDWYSWEWLKKAAGDQSVKRFHIHLHQ